MSFADFEFDKELSYNHNQRLEIKKWKNQMSKGFQMKLFMYEIHWRFSIYDQMSKRV